MLKNQTYQIPVKILKVKNEVPTVLEVNGRKYALVHETNNKGKVRN